jgi:hypothetical protein
MDEDSIIAIVVVGLIASCSIAAVIGSWVCPQTRPRRVSGYLDDDLV